MTLNEMKNLHPTYPQVKHEDVFFFTQLEQRQPEGPYPRMQAAWSVSRSGWVSQSRSLSGHWRSNSPCERRRLQPSRYPLSGLHVHYPQAALVYLYFGRLQRLSLSRTGKGIMDYCHIPRPTRRPKNPRHQNLLHQNGDADP